MKGIPPLAIPIALAGIGIGLAIYHLFTVHKDINKQLDDIHEHAASSTSCAPPQGVHKKLHHITGPPVHQLHHVKRDEPELFYPSSNDYSYLYDNPKRRDLKYENYLSII